MAIQIKGENKTVNVTSKGPGGNNIYDDEINAFSEWSSEKIIEKFCPEITYEGNSIATGYCIKEYPLKINASFTPKQEGEGDPSPENVRPISGWDSLQVTRCKKNLLDYAQLTPGPISYGLTCEKIGDNVIRVSGTATRTGNILSFVVCYSAQTSLQGKGYTIFAIPISGAENLKSAYGLRTLGESAIAIIADLVEENSYDMRFQLMITADNSTPTSYEPYQGDTYDIALPETMYGGTVDVVTGEGEKTWQYLELDGTEAWEKYSNTITNQPQYLLNTNIDLPGISEGSNRLCTHFNTSDYRYWNDLQTDAFATNATYIRIQSDYQTVDDWKAYLAAQYAAGTPVTIAYQLAAPEPFEVSPQPVLALNGVNTLYTDGDNLQVKARINPGKTLKLMQDKINIE